MADLYFLQHHELQGRHQRHHDNVENAEDVVSDDEPVYECFCPWFRSLVSEGRSREVAVMRMARAEKVATCSCEEKPTQSPSLSFSQRSSLLMTNVPFSISTKSIVTRS